MQAFQAIIQNLKQEKLNLELVNSRLIKCADQDKQTIDHLQQINSQLTLKISELTQSVSQLHYSQRPQPENTEELSNLKRQIQIQNEQHQLNLNLVY